MPTGLKLLLPMWPVELALLDTVELPLALAMLMEPGELLLTLAPSLLTLAQVELMELPPSLKVPLVLLPLEPALLDSLVLLLVSALPMVFGPLQFQTLALALLALLLFVEMPISQPPTLESPSKEPAFLELDVFWEPVEMMDPGPTLAFALKPRSF